MSAKKNDSTQGQTKTMSNRVRSLQDALNSKLKLAEKSAFVAVLNQYHMSRDVPEFVRSLKLLFSTPDKKQLFALIRKVVPKADLEEYDRCMQLDAGKFNTMPAKRSKKIRSRPPLNSEVDSKSLLSSEKQKKPKKEKSAKSKETKDKQKKHNLSFMKSPENALTFNPKQAVQKVKTALKEKGQGSEVIHHIQMHHSGDPEKGFGFSIRGGSEYGIGIYVSMVDDGGKGQVHKLVPGDLILEVNNISFHGISHQEAAQIIKGSRKLDMKVSRVGLIPGTSVVHEMYKWVDDLGRPTSPPPELEQIKRNDSAGAKSEFNLLRPGSIEQKINVSVSEGESLGLMIRGGRDFGLGIYVSGVDPMSKADECGLKVGDQILDVNGRSFLDITHAEAAAILKKSRHLMFTIKDVGKLPFGRTKFDKTSWKDKNSGPPTRRRKESGQSDSTVTQDSKQSTIFRKGIGSQLMLNTGISVKWDSIEHQASVLLNETEQGTLRYYLSEYQTEFISVDGLAMASFELLNTKAKMTMMPEIRNWVRPEDVQKFDLLLQRREAQQRHGFLPSSNSVVSLDTSQGQRSRSQDKTWSQGHNLKFSRSVPGSRVATVRERPSRTRKLVPEWELEPLRIAIEQIEDHPGYALDYEKHHQSAGLLMTDTVNQSRPNLLKTSLSSRRAMSQETLTPVYIDTTSDLPPSPRSASSSSLRSYTTSSSRQHRRPTSGYMHRQRAGSNSSTLRRKNRSVEDVRIPTHGKKLSMPYQSVTSSPMGPRRNLASHSVTHLHDSYDEEYPDSPLSYRENIIFAEVHPLPRTEAPSSDDSGVDVNGNHGNENNRVTISNENPIDIDEILESRSFELPGSQDSKTSTLTNHSIRSMSHDSNHSTLTNQSRRSVSHDSNHSTLTNQSMQSYNNRHSTLTNRSHPSISLESNHSTLTNRSSGSRTSLAGVTNRNQPDNSNSNFNSIRATSSPRMSGTLSSRRNGKYKPPVQILINDGDGSIDTLSLESPSSPRFLHKPNFGSNQSRALRRPKKGGFGNLSVSRSSTSFHQQNSDTDDDIGAEDDDDTDDYPNTRSFDKYSFSGENTDKFVSPLDHILDQEDSFGEMEHRQIEEARHKYGNIPMRVVYIYKTKPTLGMAVEGGANTRQPLPRVINLQPGGSAFESGGLKVGHVILEVNGVSLLGMEHIAAAKTIAEAFKSRDIGNVELLVTESNARIKGV
ncbi:uncharacterized protein LOC127838790 isoform X2 [Dreissena polymorpha]|uniref:uncharacterized protein LOC127838790 isoform X2 n=1 Tax=Dreissena polymorpha TaxID=45954 RepID=UPI00226429FC|nr:uncharacterized protein LOC127838790 isoform X2 [Dreissena polymorpha]